MASDGAFSTSVVTPWTCVSFSRPTIIFEGDHNYDDDGDDQNRDDYDEYDEHEHER